MAEQHERGQGIRSITCDRNGDGNFFRFLSGGQLSLSQPKFKHAGSAAVYTGEI
jgi:hypothetical protein